MQRPGLIGWYVLAAIGVTGLGLAAIVTLELAQSQVDRGLITLILGFLTTTLVSIFGLIRSAANGEGLQQVGQKADVAALKATEAKAVAAVAREELKANTILTATVNDKLDKLTP